MPAYWSGFLVILEVYIKGARSAIKTPSLVINLLLLVGFRSRFLLESYRTKSRKETTEKFFLEKKEKTLVFQSFFYMFPCNYFFSLENLTFKHQLPRLLLPRPGLGEALPLSRGGSEREWMTDVDQQEGIWKKKKKTLVKQQKSKGF